jgi:DNA-binding response OmpR family regulator
MYPMKKKVFIIEDTVEILENLKELLAIEGFEIITACNGEDAMYKFYMYTPDLIITDLRMPRMDGFALIEKIRKTDTLKSIPIIVFSANVSPENEKKSLQVGANLFLKKPCMVESLLQSIRQFI